VPIHGGRAISKLPTKDGEVKDLECDWLHNNMIGDDTGKNISIHNRELGDLTATYWAHHNYEKLGNPEYYGCFYYRKLFRYDFVWILLRHDVVCGTPSNLHIKKQFIIWHGSSAYDFALDCIKKIHPDKYEDIKNYFENKNDIYFCNFYVLKRDLFFEYSNFVEPLYLYMIEQIKEYIIDPKQKEHSIIREGICYINEEYQRRCIAYIIERCTSYFLWKLHQREGIKIQHEKIIIYEV
jgi:hypothetical protein